MPGLRNIMKFRSSRLLHPMGMMTVGFVAMAAGLCMGAYLADLRADHREISGIRKYLVLKMAHTGPKALQQAAMAAMADGSLTAKEERNLYRLADDIRRDAIIRKNGRKARIDSVNMEDRPGLQTI